MTIKIDVYVRNHNSIQIEYTQNSYEFHWIRVESQMISKILEIIGKINKIAWDVCFDEKKNNNKL